MIRPTPRAWQIAAGAMVRTAKANGSKVIVASVRPLRWPVLVGGLITSPGSNQPSLGLIQALPRRCDALAAHPGGVRQEVHEPVRRVLPKFWPDRRVVKEQQPGELVGRAHAVQQSLLAPSHG